MDKKSGKPSATIIQFPARKKEPTFDEAMTDFIAEVSQASHRRTPRKRRGTSAVTQRTQKRNEMRKRFNKQHNSGDKAVQVGFARDVTVIQCVEDNGPFMAKLKDALPTECHLHLAELRKTSDAKSLHMVVSKGALNPDLNGRKLVRNSYFLISGCYFCGSFLLAVCLPFLIAYALFFKNTTGTAGAVAGIQFVLTALLMRFTYVSVIKPQLVAAKLIHNQKRN